MLQGMDIYIIGPTDLKQKPYNTSSPMIRKVVIRYMEIGKPTSSRIHSAPNRMKIQNQRATAQEPGIVNPIALKAVPTSSVIDCAFDAKAFSKYGRCFPL